MLKKLSKGFTLIELLVVIAIIAILAALIIIRVSSASKDARNSKRCGDMSQVRSAIEQYKGKGGTVKINVGATNLTKALNEGAGLTFPDANPPSTFLAGGDYPPEPSSGSNYQISTDASSNYTLTTTNAADGTPTCNWPIKS